MLMRHALLLLGATVLAGPLFPEARAQTFTGQGRAVMGSSMTPSGTKALAFEKARQSALETFGAQVLSRKSVSTLETPRDVKEVTKSKIAVLAAGETHLVEGSKSVTREMTESAVLYRVRAEFRIEPTDVTETLKAYLQTGQDAPLRRLVSDAVRLQRRLTEVGPETDSKEVRRLIGRAKDAYKQVAAATEEMRGGKVWSQIARQRRRRKNALLRFFRVVKQQGHPRHMLEFSLSRAGVQDEGDRVRFTYATEVSRGEGVGAISSACRETRPTWAPDDSKANGIIGRPATDGWLKQIFGDTYLDFEVTGPALLYMLDGTGHVRLIVAKTSGGIMSPPKFRIEYGHCAPYGMIDHRLWEDTWEFQVPTRLVGQIEQVALAFSKWDYDEITGKHGFRAVERGIYARGKGQDVGLETFTYGRSEFVNYVGKYATKVKQMGSAP